MDFWTAGAAIALVLCIGLWVPYYIWYIRRGRAHGHTWFTRWKPRGHSDIGPDVRRCPPDAARRRRRATGRGPDASTTGRADRSMAPA